MRICHVITRLIIGGAQENTLLTCEGLTNKGHDVTLVAGPETGPEGSLWPWAEATCGRVVRVKSLRRNVRPHDDIRCLGDLRRVFQASDFDVVHTHSSKAGILGRLAAHKAGIPAVVHTIHGMSFNRTQPLAVRAFYRCLERRAARHTDAFVAVADAMTDQAVAAGLAPRERFTTVYSGMRTEQFAPDPTARERMRTAWRVPPTAVVVGTIARLFNNKGYEELLPVVPRAVAAGADLFFVWVGGGPRQRDYERALAAAGVRDRVHFTGLVEPDAIPALLNGFDLLAHTSRWEGLPRAAVQALLTEIPVVAFAVDGAPEVVIPAKTGALVPLGDLGALERALVDLANAPVTRRNLGRNGRQLCLGRFDHHHMVAELEALYHRLRSGRSDLG